MSLLCRLFSLLSSDQLADVMLIAAVKSGRKLLKHLGLLGGRYNAGLKSGEFIKLS